MKIHDIANELDKREKAERAVLDAKIEADSQYLAKKIARAIQSASVDDFKKIPEGVRITGTLFAPGDTMVAPERVGDILTTTYKIENISRTHVGIIYRKFSDTFAVFTCLLGPLVACLHDMFYLTYGVDFVVSSMDK